jgi:hypothetical protein
MTTHRIFSLSRRDFLVKQSINIHIQNAVPTKPTTMKISQMSIQITMNISLPMGRDLFIGPSL